MKNKGSSRILWLIWTVALAMVCAALRRWQLSTAFEGELGLPVKNAPASMALGCMIVISAAVFGILSSRQRVARLPRGSDREPRWNNVLSARGDVASLTAMVAAAFLALAAVPVLFNDGRQLWAIYSNGIEKRGDNGILLILTAVTAVAAFLGLLLSSRAAYRGEEKGRSLIALPAINGCIWLMESYRGHAANPVLWDYVPLLLAIIFGMLFYTECAGLTAGVYHPRRTLWLTGMSVIFSAVAVAGGCELGNSLLLISQLVAALAILWRLPGNLENPPAAVQPDQPLGETQEIQEEEPDE